MAKTKTIFLLLVLLMASLFGACSTIEKEPTHFHYLSPTIVQSDMQNMADQIALITLTLLNADSTNEESQKKVLSMLDRIENIAQTFTVGGEALTNYSVINRYMGAFLYDIGIAREFALREPANLLPAGRLVKSCMSCHDSI